MDAVVQFDEFTLNWTANYAAGCEAPGDWSGAKAASGKETLPATVAGTKTYSLTCEGAGESLIRSVNVEVSPALVAENIALEGVYLAQTHVAQPSNTYFNLTSNRPALLKVDLPSTNRGISPTVTAVIFNAGTKETFTFWGPSQLPFPAEISAELSVKFNIKWPTVLPRWCRQSSYCIFSSIPITQ